MELALPIGIFLLGVVFGALVAIAIMSDKPCHDLHTSPDNLEARSRRVQ